MTSALLWGFVAAASLLLGAVLGVARQWPSRLVGAVLAFGGGALIASISFELAEEGVTEGGAWPVGLGMAVGALTYFVANRLVERSGQPPPRRAHGRAVATPSGPDRRRASGGTSRGRVLGLWLGVTVVCTLATLVGYLVADHATASMRGAVDGFAAGALLVMLTDSLVPEAREKCGETAGLVTALGFALAAGLSLLS